MLWHLEHQLSANLVANIIKNNTLENAYFLFLRLTPTAKLYNILKMLKRAFLLK